MQTVQFAIADAAYTAALREALLRSGPWHAACVDRPDVTQDCVLVVDEQAFHRLVLPLAHPERVVLITHKDPQHLSRAWEAGIVSVVSAKDPTATVLLAIMAAALRISRSHGAAPEPGGGISPTAKIAPAPISPKSGPSGPKSVKPRLRQHSS